MNHLFDYWAALNTILIMMALGLVFDHKALDHHYPILARAALGYNLLLPLLAWFAIYLGTDWFSDEVLLAMLLCILCMGGTSAGAFVTRVRGSSPLAGTLIVALVALSLVSVTVLSFLGSPFAGRSTFDTLPVAQLAAYLLLITLAPFLTGISWMHHRPARAHRWHPIIDRAGSVLTLLLIIALTVRYAVEILGGPKAPLYAAALLILLFTIPPLLMERKPSLRRTLTVTTLIRNLTLVLSLLAVLPDAGMLLPTVLAFGLFMYLASGVLVFVWRK